MLRKVNIAVSWQRAKQQFAALTAERDELRRERDEYRARLHDLQVCVQERWAAEHRLADLYRERAIVRARAAERDPALPLQ